MKPSSPKPSDESIGEDRPLAFSITSILHHVSSRNTISYAKILDISLKVLDMLNMDM